SDSDVQLSGGDKGFEDVIKAPGGRPVSRGQKRGREVARTVWIVSGDNIRGYSERFNPGLGDCGPYVVGQLASSETPSFEELVGYRREGVQYVLDNPATFGDDFWEGDTREDRSRSRNDWATTMRRP
ncbi:unnamed protein product, partial [Ectocarpus sp. 8 AP-2014]